MWFLSSFIRPDLGTLKYNLLPMVRNPFIFDRPSFTAGRKLGNKWFRRLISAPCFPPYLQATSAHVHSYLGTDTSTHFYASSRAQAEINSSLTCDQTVFFQGSARVVSKSTDEWPRVTTSDHEWPLVTISDQKWASVYLADIIVISSLCHFMYRS